MSTMVISGSARDQHAVWHWVEYWQERGHDVIDYPSPIPAGELRAQYETVFRSFYECLADCDALFVMNVNRGDVTGYVGAATFGELSYAIARNACGHKPVDIVLLQPPGDDVLGVDEIRLWSDLGWVEFHKAVEA